MTNGTAPGMAPPGVTPGAFLAAIIAAQKSDCVCETCKILRNMGNKMIAEYTGV